MRKVALALALFLPTSILAQDDADIAALYPKHLNAKTEKAIAKGLKYLASTQRNDGTFTAGGNYANYLCTMTSLSGMAFVAGGNTPSRGTYSKQVRKAAEALMKMQGSDGMYASRTDGRSMYGHGFAMLFLAQVYGTEPNTQLGAKIRKSLTAGVKLSIRAQSRRGGWYYNPSPASDEGSVTITQVQALRAAYNAGIKVPKKVMTASIRYIEGSINGDGGVAYTMGQRGGSRPPISAAGLAAMYSSGQYKNPKTKKILNYCEMTFLKGTASRQQYHYYYTHMYAAMAFYQAGPKYWDRYFPKVRDDLLRRQGASGSWSDGRTGPAYGTGIALMVLQLPYSYLPIVER